MTTDRVSATMMWHVLWVDQIFIYDIFLFFDKNILTVFSNIFIYKRHAWTIPAILSFCVCVHFFVLPDGIIKDDDDAN